MTHINTKILLKTFDIYMYRESHLIVVFRNSLLLYYTYNMTKSVIFLNNAHNFITKLLFSDKYIMFMPLKTP